MNDASPRGGLVADLGVYALATLVAQGATFVLIPYLTRALGPAEYGVFELLQVAASFAVTMLMLGADTAIVTMFYDEGEEGRRVVVSSGGWFVLAVTATAAGLVTVLARPTSSGLLDVDRSSAVVAAAAMVPTVALAALGRQVLRLERRRRPYLAVAILGAATQLALVVSLVARSESAAAALAGLAAGSGVAAVACAVLARHLLSARPRRSAVGLIVRRGAPVMLATLAGWSLLFADRFILSRFVTLEELGYYALAAKLVLVINLVLYSFGAAWPPYILPFRNEDPVAAERLWSKALPGLVAGVALIGAPVAAFAPEVVVLVAGDAYRAAADAVPALVIGFLLFASVTVTQTAMLATGRTRALVAPSALGAAANIVACLALSPWLGIVGAAWATVAGFAVQAVLTYRRAQRIVRVPYETGVLVGLALVVVPVASLGWWDTSSPTAFVVKGIAVCLLPMALVLVRALPMHPLVELRRSRAAAQPG